MIFIVHAESKSNTISSSLGLEDYSYYFVLQQFRPVLESLGLVIEVDDARPYVDHIYSLATALGEKCVFLSFTPPHKTPSGLLCPTVPVFAWEYSTIPNEEWNGDPKNNWATDLMNYSVAITHSQQTCEATKYAIDNSYPIASIPAPLWDEFKGYYNAAAEPCLKIPVDIEFDGWTVDSANFEKTLNAQSEEAARHIISLSGVVYTSIFNPNDGRKNWQALLQAFCWVFKATPDVTLVLKLTHADPTFSFHVVAAEVQKLMPFQCRVVLIQGYLSDEEYMELIQVSSYVVNSAYGEGQCLPLMEFMSAGKPAVAPDHSGMADYINSKNSFVVRSSNEWTHWPHDPRVLLRAFRRRVDWGSLCDSYRASYEEAIQHPDAYKKRAVRAREDLKLHCSRAVARERVESILSVCETHHPQSYRSRRQRLAGPLYSIVWKVLGWVGLKMVLARATTTLIRVARKILRPQA